MFRRTGRLSVGLSLAFLLSVTALRSLSATVKVRPPAIDFGERGHNESPQATIEFTNEFTIPVRLIRLKPSCSCIKVSPTAFAGPLAPGRAATVSVTMSSGRAFGKLTKYIEIDVVGDTGPIGKLRVPVSMSVFENYRLEPRELRFESQYGGSPVTVSALVRTKGKRSGQPVDLKFIRIKDRSRRLPTIQRFFTVKVSDHPQGATISATLSPAHPEGRVWGEFEALLDGKRLVLPIAGDMFRGILLRPKYFNFNRVETAIAATHVEAAVLRATDGRPFKILSMTSRLTRPTKNPGFTVELSLDSGQDVHEHVLQARVVAPSGFPVGTSFSGKITVKTTHPDKPQVELGFFGFFAKPRK